MIPNLVYHDEYKLCIIYYPKGVFRVKLRPLNFYK